MFKNYLKIAFRSLVKQGLYSGINIFGLAFGMACVLLIVIFIHDELSYDEFHEDADDIYRIVWWSDNPQTRTPHPMAQALVQDFPQVISATSLSPIWGPGLTKETLSIRNLEKDLTFDESQVLSVDSTFLDVFSFELINGNRNEVLRNVGGLLLSESTARKYFGDEDPLGKALAINSDSVLMLVEGVFKDVPENSHFHFDLLISYVTMKAIEEGNGAYYSWADFGHFNYIRLTPGSDPIALQNQFMDWALGYMEVSEEDMQRVSSEDMHFRLQRVTDIHLNSRIRWELEPNGNIGYVYIMSAAAFMILIIACVNFMNLTTTRSTERSKEIGIRKSLGAFRKQVRLQFLGESVLTSMIAMVLAGLIAEVSLPVFNQMTNKSLSIEYWQHPVLIALLLGAGIITGILSGLYPALFLSSINPVISLKGVDKIRPKGAWFRKSLMVFQFVVSMELMTGSIIIINQLQFMNNKDLGFDKEHVVVVPFKNENLLGSFDAIQAELLNINGVNAVSGSSNIPGKQFNQNPIFATDKPQSRISSSEVFVDYDIFETMNIELVAGRGFAINNPADSNAFVINETAARSLSLDDPVGKEITWAWDNNGQPPAKGTVIGVVKDFNYNSLHEPIRPLLFSLSRAFNYVLIKLDENASLSTVASIEKVWKKFETRFEFEYSFLSDDLEVQYAVEDKTAKVFSGFSFIAIVIACFGLFGIASLSFSQRAKEVSIRKVLGASTSKLLLLLLSDFIQLIFVAIVIAAPLVWIIMNFWLQNFTFRVEVNIMDFIMSALALLLVALLTVSYLTWSTARQNPVDNLKEQ